MKDEARRILIVDPDRLFAGRLSATLSCQGCDVETTEGIARAAQRLKDVEFDCVVLDEDLPEIKGHDAVPVLKVICPGVPIIMTAARNSLELELKIRRQDVFFYHVKAFDLDELELAVRDALRKIGKCGRATTYRPSESAGDRGDPVRCPPDHPLQEYNEHGDRSRTRDSRSHHR